MKVPEGLFDARDLSTGHHQQPFAGRLQPFQRGDGGIVGPAVQRQRTIVIRGQCNE